MKKFLTGFFKFILVFILIILIIAVGLIVYYYVTKQDAASYLPDDFFIYVKIKSLRDIYDNVIDLKAVDLVFSSSKDLKAIQKTILEFKSNEISKNYFFKKLLEVRADVVIAPDYSPIIVLNPGILSLVTRFFPQVNSILKLEGVTTTQQGKLTYHHFQTGENGGVFFSVKDNLVFLSPNVEHIKNLYKNYETDKNLMSNKDAMDLREKIKAGGFTEVYVNSRNLIDSIAEGNNELKSILEQITFNSYSAFSFRLSNRDIFLSAYTTLSVPNDKLRNFLSYNPSSLQVIKYLPASTNIYTTLNCKSFKDLLDIVFYFKEGPDSKTMKTIENSAKMLLGATTDELLFDWVGSELGVFTMEATSDPVVFLKVQDAPALEKALKKITDAIFFDRDTSLVLDNVRVNRIKFPAFIKGIVDLFIKGIETPYYITLGDYIFFSINAENLSNLSNHYKSNETLIREDNYKAVTQEIPKNANIFLYYDLSSALPAFLAQNTLINRLFRLYETGVFSIHYNENEVKVQISASGVAGNKTVSFPGFPVPADTGIESDVYCSDVTGSKSDDLVYIDNNNNLIIRDRMDEKEYSAPVEKNSDIYIPRERKKEIVVFSQSGTLFLFNGEAHPLDPFPLITQYKGSFFPQEYLNTLVFYSDVDKSLYFVSQKGNEERFHFDFSSALLSPPAFLDGLAAFYPKSFSGTVYLTDMEGNVLDGWPREGGSISYCSPVLFKNEKNEIMVLFLTQSGVLSMWGKDGAPVNGFPVYLKGVFYNNPVLISSGISPLYGKNGGKAILVFSADGDFILVSMDGEIIKEKRVPDTGDRRARFLLFDIDRDGIEEIFVYGIKNHVIGIGRNFELLPGFPVKGSKKPSFTDLNFDNIYEMVVGSYDGNIYAYTLSK
ncbi:MAG: DUF3352 domain-containing protein [Spirochaetales bacterium]|nr:DUF3352 domain-containing protein [Spirochaetales bacterium]